MINTLATLASAAAAVNLVYTTSSSCDVSEEVAPACPVTDEMAALLLDRTSWEFSPEETWDMWPKTAEDGESASLADTIA